VPPPSSRRRRRPGATRTDAPALYDDNGNGRITCAEARRHGFAPVPRSNLAYRYMRDGNGDGVVCEARLSRNGNRNPRAQRPNPGEDPGEDPMTDRTTKALLAGIAVRLWATSRETG